MTSLFLCILHVHAHRRIAAVDFGNEWLKISLVDLDNPNKLAVMDVVLDEQSERKQPNAVGLNAADERSFGQDAKGLYYRDPSRAFLALKRLVGASSGDEATQRYKADVGSYDLGVNAAGHLSFKGVPDTGDASVNLLVAMQFEHIKALVENHIVQTGQPAGAVTEAVLLVPEHFTDLQRSLFAQLAAQAGFSVELVVSELLAAAADFAVRNKEAVDQKEKLVFFGMGAAGSAATLVELSWEKQTIVVTELATASQASFGGQTFDARIRDFLIGKFDEEHKAALGDSVSTSPKALAKLSRAANKAKEQLGVSASVDVRLESLFKNKDLALKLSEEVLVSLISDLFPAMADPIAAVLPEGAVPVELVGGGWRVKAFQRYLSTKFPTVTFGKHVDGDEGALLGGAALAATVLVRDKPLPEHLTRVKVVTKNKHVVSDVLGSVEGIKAELQRWNKKLQEKLAVEHTRSEVQSLVLEIKGYLEDENSDVIKFASKSQRQGLETLTDDISEYLSTLELEDKPDLDTLQTKLRELKEKYEAAKKASEAGEKKAKKPKKEENEAKKREKARDRQWAINKAKEEKEAQQKKRKEL